MFRVRSYLPQNRRKVGTHAGELSGYLEDGFLAGTLDCVVIAVGAERTEIKRVRVEPGFRRRSFGGRALGRLEERAGEPGFSNLTLDTTIRREGGARRLYLKVGFRQTGRVRICPFDCRFFEKRLELEADAG